MLLADILYWLSHLLTTHTCLSRNRVYHNCLLKKWWFMPHHSLDVPSGKRLTMEIIMLLMGKSTISTGPCSIAMWLPGRATRSQRFSNAETPKRVPCFGPEFPRLLQISTLQKLTSARVRIFGHGMAWERIMGPMEESFSQLKLYKTWVCLKIVYP